VHAIINASLPVTRNQTLTFFRLKDLT